MRTQILILGAGKSATFLIQYLQKKAVENNWYVLLADHDLSLAQLKWNNQPQGEALEVNIEDPLHRAAIIQQCSVVVSMLPPTLHFLVAMDCIKFEKSLFTASYADAKMWQLQNEVLERGLFFLNEMGLDPGIDHMSAMQLIDKIKSFGGKITGFKSHCGGLIAPESDTNPWHYKISWNPRNIILAGKAGAIYLKDGQIKEEKYEQLFEKNKQIQIPEIGTLAYYPNRNSLSYIDTYSLQGINNFVRTTLRYPAFCMGWNVIVQLGLTDETIWNTNIPTTLKEWFSARSENQHFKTKYELFMQDQMLAEQLNYLSLSTEEDLPNYVNSNASLLQWRLEKKWHLDANDKDLVVMMHEIEYTLHDKKFKATSTLILKGKDGSHTAMAKTVGYPLAMSVCAYLKGEISLKGIHLPIHSEIYTPILENLAKEGIVFEESIEAIKP